MHCLQHHTCPNTSQQQLSKHTALEKHMVTFLQKRYSLSSYHLVCSSRLVSFIWWIYWLQLKNVFCWKYLTFSRLCSSFCSTWNVLWRCIKHEHKIGKTMTAVHRRNYMQRYIGSIVSVERGWTSFSVAWKSQWYSWVSKVAIWDRWSKDINNYLNWLDQWKVTTTDSTFYLSKFPSINFMT